MKEKIKSSIKKIIIPTLSLFILMFIPVFIMSNTTYYQEVENKNNRLTTNAMEKFENDVLKGEKIVASNYLEEKKTYDNLFSRLALATGELIEKFFNKAMKFILKEIEGAIK